MKRADVNGLGILGRRNPGDKGAGALRDCKYNACFWFETVPQAAQPALELAV